MTPIQHIASLRERADDYQRKASEAADDALGWALAAAWRDCLRQVASEIEQQLDEWELVPENETGYEAMYAETNGMADCPDFPPGTELRHHVDGSHSIVRIDGAAA